MTPPTQSAARTERGQTGRGLEWARVVAAISVIIVSTLVMVRLHERADEYRQVENMLSHLNAAAQELNGLEWEAIAEGKVDSATKQRLAVIHNESTVLIWHLTLASRQSQQIEEVSRRFKAYAQTANEEFKLIAAGNIEAARKLDEARVDPAYDAFADAIREATTWYVDVAERGIRTANLSALLTLLLAILFIGLLYWRLNRARLASLLAEAEQKTLSVANEALQAEVTNRQRAEQRLADALNFNRAMLAASPVGIVSFKASGGVSWANPAAAQIIGGTEEQLKAQNFRQLESWKHTGLLAAAEQALATGEEQQVEAHVTTTFGKKVWLAFRFVTFRYDNEIHLLAAFSDVTGRKQMEDSLRQSEERYRELVESAQDVVFTISPDAVITSLNPAFETVTGWPRAEWIGKAFSPLVHPDDLPHALEMFKRVLGGEKTPLFGLRILSRSAQPLFMEFTATLQIEDGKPVAVRGFGRDVTARKQFEDRSRQAQKMEAIGLLAGGVAHDFNNILTAIQGNVSLLQMGEATDAEQAHMLEEISRSADRAAGLVRQLLTFSRRQVTQPRELELNAVVTNLVPMLQRLMGEHIALVTRCAPDPTPVRADCGMLEQVLINLAVNARDAMPNGGQLTIQTGMVSLDSQSLRSHPKGRPGRFVRLSVTDTGCGIAPEHLPRIFEPFFTTKDVGKGTGLGLATVFGIVEEHQGWIEVETHPGKGTTFHICLPYSTGSAEATPEPGAKAEWPRGVETILLVEDEPPVRSLIGKVLERHGYRVHEAGSGTEALDVWTENHANFDLLLTDMMMPEGMNGWELSDRLRAEKPNLKVIYSSGYSEEFFGEHAPLQNESHFLPKPYDAATLLQKVRACLDAP